MTGTKNKAAGADDFGTEDFDFASMDWGNGNDDDGALKGADSTAFGDEPFPASDDFGSSFGGDAGFGGTEPKDSEDPFGSDDAFGAPDAFSGTNESFGSDDGFGDNDFGQMPSPGANPDSSTPGNPDDEFADIGGTTGFEPDHEQADPFAENADPFADAPAPAAEEDDAFEAFGSDQPAEAAPAAQPARASSGTSKVGKLIFPVAALAVVGAVGFVGYTQFVAPQPAPTTDTAVLVPPDNSGSFPSTLPPADGGNIQIADGTLPPTEPTTTTPSVNLDGDTSAPPAVGEDAPAIPVPSVTPPTAQPDDELTGGDRAGLGTAAAPVLVPLPGATQPDAAPVPNVAIDPADEAPSPGTLPAAPSLDVPATEPAPAPALPAAAAPAQDDGPTAADMDALESRLSALERRIEELSKGMPATAAEAPAPAPAEAATPSEGTRPALASGTVPPLKPILVDGVTLKGVSLAKGVAWVSTTSGVVEVKVGDVVPNAGKVVRIRPYAGDWILVTEKGLVPR
jgi:hypothetical protein